MGSRQAAIPAEAAAPRATGFAAMGARRLLVFFGIGLIASGLLLGDIFAVFILHPNNARIGARLEEAAQTVAAGDSQAVGSTFAAIGELLENRRSKVQAHLHVIELGYLALVFAVLEPWMAMEGKTRRRLAVVFLLGAALLPLGFFVSYYLGNAFSPLRGQGWGNLLVYAGGALVAASALGLLTGAWRGLRSAIGAGDALLRDRSWSGKVLLAGGTILVLLGFLHGAWYAGLRLYEHEAAEGRILKQAVDRAAAEDMRPVRASLSDYALLQGERAVAIAAHAHIIKFGILAMLLAFIQPYVYLSERWRRRWAVALLVGGLLLPIAVQSEIRWGLKAGAVADSAGLLVFIALLGMLAGVFRYTGVLDSAAGVRS